MFVRIRKRIGKSGYPTYYGQVLESVWTAAGPRQRIIVSFRGASLDEAAAALRSQAAITRRDDNPLRKKSEHPEAWEERAKAEEAHAAYLDDLAAKIGNAEPAPPTPPKPSPAPAGSSPAAEAEIAALRRIKELEAQAAKPRPAATPSQANADEIAALKKKLVELRNENLRLPPIPPNVIEREFRKASDALAKAKERIRELEQRSPEQVESDAVKKLETKIKGLRTRILNQKVQLEFYSDRTPSNLSEEEIMQMLKVLHPDTTPTVAQRTAVTQKLNAKLAVIRQKGKEAAEG